MVASSHYWAVWGVVEVMRIPHCHYIRRHSSCVSVGESLFWIHSIGTCGADFLPSSTTSNSGSISADVQIVLSPAFAGCGRLMRYNVIANCPNNGNQICNIVFQLWRPTETGYFILLSSTSTGYDPEANNHQPEMLSFPLDMKFTDNDMVGFYHDQPNPLIVHMALAGNRSYLQWSSMPDPSNMLRIADATTILAHLPILNVESKCMLLLDTLHMILCQLHVYGHPLIHLWFKLHHADTAIII